MPAKQKSNPKFGQQNWLGDATQPRIFTKYTIPGILFLAAVAVAKGVEYLMYLVAIMTFSQWALETTGTTTTATQPITQLEWCVAGVAVIVAAIRYRRRTTKKAQR